MDKFTYYIQVSTVTIFIDARTVLLSEEIKKRMTIEIKHKFINNHQNNILNQIL